MHGPYRAWWPNGKLGTVGQYENGVTEGKWSGWYSNGHLQGYEWFKAGKLVRGRYWDESGKPMKNPPNPMVNPDLAHKPAQGQLP
jgi:antitoxin component YwqK of YwqJK toxin-antitoxin module